MILAASLILAAAQAPLPASAPPTSPAACRHDIMARVAQGHWQYITVVPNADGTLQQRTGAIAARRLSEETLEVSYPGARRPPFRLTRTQTGYRSEGQDARGQPSVAEVRVVSCSAPDAQRVRTDPT